MDSQRCGGVPIHALCQGKYTKQPEDYTDGMVSIIHRARARSVEARVADPSAAPGTAPRKVQAAAAAAVRAAITPNALRPRRVKAEVPSADIAEEARVRHHLDAPAMPLRDTPYEHRERNSAWPQAHAAVARPVPPREVKTEPKAQSALQLEWDNLNAKGVWDLTSVRERADVQRDARESGQKVHVGRVFGMCVEKRVGAPHGGPGPKVQRAVRLPREPSKRRTRRGSVLQRALQQPSNNGSSKSYWVYTQSNCFYISVTPGAAKFYSLFFIYF